MLKYKNVFSVLYSLWGSIVITDNFLGGPEGALIIEVLLDWNIYRYIQDIRNTMFLLFYITSGAEQ